MAETRTGEMWADALERLVVRLERYNDVRESQRPPPCEDDAPPTVVELPRDPHASQH